MAKAYPEGTALGYNIGEEWTKETGGVQTQVIDGEQSEVYARYLLEKAAAATYSDARLASIRYEPNNGRARLVKAFVREDNVIEELYEVDVIKDIRCAPDFVAQLSDEECAEVSYFFENLTSPVHVPEGWGDYQRLLFKHLIHGADSYKETAFELRIAKYVSLATSAPVADLTHINEVVELPSLSANMQRLVATLPTGEWLQGAMQCEHLGKGRWRIDNLLQWAKKWSVIYGGTLFADD